MASHSPEGSTALNLRVLSGLPFLNDTLSFLLHNTTSNNSHSKLSISKSPISYGIIYKRTSLFLNGSNNTLGEFYLYFKPCLQITFMFLTAIGICNGFYKNILKVTGESIYTFLYFLLTYSLLSCTESESYIPTSVISSMLSSDNF